MNKTKERPTSQPITVNIDKLSAMLSCGHATARKIGEQAGAKIVIGRRVLYSVEKVKIAKLNQILTGYYHYYGITDNTESITAFRYNIMRSLFYCLNRRSQKKSYNWVEFLNMLDNSYPLVRPRIYVNIYE